MGYTRKENDIAFRRINLNRSTIPEFQSFMMDLQTLDDVEDSTVIEVKSENSIFIANKANRKNISCSPYVSKRNCLGIPSYIPTAHLSIKTGNSHTEYKLPNNLTEENGQKIFLIPGGISGVELCGDKYFNAAYQIINTNK